MANVLAHLTEAELRKLGSNSIERVINSTMKILDECVPDSADEHLSELHSTNQQDWDELKRIVVKIWNNAVDERFIQQQAESK